MHDITPHLLQLAQSFVHEADPTPYMISLDRASVLLALLQGQEVSRTRQHPAVAGCWCVLSQPHPRDRARISSNSSRAIFWISSVRPLFVPREIFRPAESLRLELAAITASKASSASVILL